MTSGFDTSKQGLLQAAADCDSTATSMDSELIAIKNYVLSLNGIWMGDAKLEFEVLMAPNGPWDQHSKALHQALVGAAGTLRTTAANYELGDMTNKGEYTAIIGSFPPANL